MTNILTAAEAATVLRCETTDADMLALLPLVDAFIKDYSGRDWAADTTIHPLAKALARMIITVWHEDPSMTASGPTALGLGIRNLMYTMKGLARSEDVSGVPDAVLAIQRTNIGYEMAIGANIVLVFNHEMATSATSAVTLQDANGANVAVTNTLDVTKRILTINPTASLTADSGYKVVLTAAADIYGQTLTETIEFRTA